MSMHYCRYLLIEREDELILVEGEDILLVVPNNQAVRILEYVGGKTITQCLDQMNFWTSPEVYKAWNKARQIYQAKQKDNKYFRISPHADTPYLYFYLAISDPERIAGIQKEKLVRYIENEINRSFVTFKNTWIEFCELTGMMNFLNAGYIQWRPDKLEDHILERMGTILKPGKVARILNKNEENVEVFAGYLQDVLYENNPEKLEIKTSDYPSTIYTMQHDEDITSCMVNDDENEVGEDYFDLYDILDNCSIAYISETDEYGDEILLARALLWENITVNGIEKPIKIMDRIYFASNRHLMAMERWAANNGYYRKTTQALNILTFYPPDSMTPVELTKMSFVSNVKFTYRKFKFVPYVDTFSWIKKNETIMSTFPETDCIQLSNTDGDGYWLTYGSHYRCDHCYDELDKDHFEDDDEHHYCDSCRDALFTKCDVCRTYIRDNSGKIENREVNGEYINICKDCLNDYTYCEYAEAYFSEDHFITVTFIDGHTERISDEGIADHACFVECADCGKWFHEDAANKVETEWYCDDCYDWLEECPCCHELSDKLHVWNHTLHMWVCPHCVDESKIHPEKESEPCSAIDRQLQYHLLDWAYGNTWR